MASTARARGLASMKTLRARSASQRERYVGSQNRKSDPHDIATFLKSAKRKHPSGIRFKRKRGPLRIESPVAVHTRPLTGTSSEDAAVAAFPRMLSIPRLPFTDHDPASCSRDAYASSSVPALVSGAACVCASGSVSGSAAAAVVRLLCVDGCPPAVGTPLNGVRAQPEGSSATMVQASRTSPSAFQRAAMMRDPCRITVRLSVAVVLIIIRYGGC